MTKRNDRSMDLTEGPILKQIVVFTMPIFLGNLFQNLYNSVDSVVVGNFVGKMALAAVNACSPITNLLVGFFTGMSTGASVIFSRCFGAKDYKKLKKAIHTTITFSLIVGVVLGLAGILFSGPLLRVVSCPEDVFADADRYLKVYTAGLLFTCIYNVGASVLRATGDSRSPFIALVTASCINIVLDVLFVRVLEMGVMGVAVATILAQSVSVVMVFYRMMKMDEAYRFSFRELSMDLELLKEIMDLGLPAGIQASLVSISNMFVHRYINSFGSTATAGVGVANRLDRFIGMPVQSLGLSVTTFVSQNIGANKKDRVSRSLKINFVMGILSVLIIGLPIILWSNFFLGLFNGDADVINVGARMMIITYPFRILMVIGTVMGGALRGYGYSRQNMILSLIGMIGIRQLFLAVSMSINWNIDNVFIGFPVGWFFQALALTLYYFYLKKKGYLDKHFKEA